MMADPKIERFLDTFPSQWMQLENVLSATPDPAKARLFQRDRKNNAGTQMVLEPLLLFDAVFLENRPIVELIKPEFCYQSDFLRTWYTSDLKPPVVDAVALEEENRTNDERRKSLEAAVAKMRNDIAALEVATQRKVLTKALEELEQALKAIPQARDLRSAQAEATEKYEVSIMDKLVSPIFERLPVTDPRYGGILTNAAMATMTSGPDRTHPISRGSWIIEVILNDPPPPPPNDVPPLKEDDTVKDLTV